MPNGDDRVIDMTVPPPKAEETVEGTESLAEEIAVATGRDLRSQKTRRELDRILREQAVESHLHRVVVWGLYIVALSAAFMFLVLIWHFITPWPFLGEDQLANVKQFLFSGTIGAAVSGLAKKYLGFSDPPPD